MASGELYQAIHGIAEDEHGEASGANERREASVRAGT